MYYKLKTSFLEETLSEALEDDSFDLSILESSSQDCSDISTVDITQLTNSALMTDRSGNLADISTNSNISFDRTLPEAAISTTNANSSNPVVVSSADFDAEKFEQLNEKAWGPNLNQDKNDNAENVKRAEMSAKVRQEVSSKLYKNSNFSLRNPKKSLSKSSLRSSNSFSSQSSSQKELLPDLETILSQKSQNSDSETIGKVLGMNSSQRAPGTTLDNQINLQWLNRCSNSNALDASQRECIPTAADTSNVATKYGISNLNLDALNRVEHPVTVSSKTMLSFDMCNLKLDSVGPRVSGSGVENTYSYSDEDEIANSEEEETNVDSSEPQIRSIRHVLKKRKLNDSNESTVTSATETSPVQKPLLKSSVENEELSKPTVTKAAKPKKAKKTVRKRATTVAAPIVRRRSTRVSKAVQREVQDYKIDSDSDNAVDPFAEDDSDADPDFLKDKANDNEIVDSSGSDEESAEQEPKPVKPSKRATKKPVDKSVKSNPKTKRITKPRNTKSKMAETKNNDNDEGDKDEKENQPEDYQLDFGMDTIKSVPRIDIAELAKSTEVFTEYVHKQVLSAGTTAKATTSQHTAPVTKQSLDRAKLEKRIAAGTLDENFVRINLRKKVFVRGKKTMNFSRYKKTQWRQKKAAALAGPDMDMRGCDGGILTCFQCGQPGHFAQNCKIKSMYNEWMHRRLCF